LCKALVVKEQQCDNKYSPETGGVEF